jgi:hypothetical protein
MKPTTMVHKALLPFCERSVVVSKMIYSFYGILVLEYVDYVSTPIHHPLIRGGCGSYPHRNAIPKSIIRPRVIKNQGKRAYGGPVG